MKRAQYKRQPDGSVKYVEEEVSIEEEDAINRGLIDLSSALMIAASFEEKAFANDLLDLKKKYHNLDLTTDG